MVLKNLAGVLGADMFRFNAAHLVKNDDQNAPPAEKRDERLTAPLLRLLPGGCRGS